MGCDLLSPLPLRSSLIEAGSQKNLATLVGLPVTSSARSFLRPGATATMEALQATWLSRETTLDKALDTVADAFGDLEDETYVSSQNYSLDSSLLHQSSSFSTASRSKDEETTLNSTKSSTVSEAASENQSAADLTASGPIYITATSGSWTTEATPSTLSHEEGSLGSQEEEAFEVMLAPSFLETEETFLGPKCLGSAPSNFGSLKFQCQLIIIAVMHAPTYLCTALTYSKMFS